MRQWTRLEVVATWLLLPLPLAILVNMKGVNTMHIGFASKAAFMSGIGYTSKGVGLGIHAVGTGFVKTGEALQSAGDTLTEFGEKKIATGKACWKASNCDCDPTKLTDEEILATGSVNKEELAEIRQAQAQVKTAEPAKAEAKAAEAPAETKKAEPEGETIEVSPAEAAAMMC